MSRDLEKVEKEILEYLRMKASNCEEIKSCTNNDFNCGYAEPREGKAITHELCCYVEGICNCQFDFENNRPNGEYSGSTYKSVLKATESLEKKGYINRNKERTELPEPRLVPDSGFIWWMSHQLSDDYLKDK